MHESQITGPDGKVVYHGERESSNKYTFAAYVDGQYTYCFSNAMSTMTPKTVMFSMDIGEEPKKDETGQRESCAFSESIRFVPRSLVHEYTAQHCTHAGIECVISLVREINLLKLRLLLTAGAEAATGTAGDTKLEDMINELHTAMTGVKHEQEYMMIRDRIHRSISESTNSRVVIWAIFENLVIFTMTLGQVSYRERNYRSG